MSKFFQELKERNVIKEGIAYLVVSWMILQVSSIVFPLIDTPQWVMKTLLLFLVIGFPAWLIFAWMYEFTADGLKRNKEAKAGKISVAKRGNRLNGIIIGALLIAVILLLYDRITHRSSLNDTLAIVNPVNKEKSVAVLPFDNMSNDSESQVFCDGVTEDIILNLSHLKDLKVISRTSSMHYKGSTKKLPEIAKELGVSYILEGSVRKYGNNVRIVAQLIEAVDDVNVWGNNFDRDLKIKDIFSVQSEVAYMIAKALKVQISDEEEQVLGETPTTNSSAYELLLEGRALADSRSVSGLRESVQKLEEALNLDPQYSDALAELANSTWLYGYYSNDVDNEEAYKNAEILAERALNSNPKNGRAYSVLANIYFRTNRFEEVVEAFEKALKINPNDATTHHQYSIFYDNQGDSEKAFYHSEKALDNDPLSLIVNFHYLNLLLSNDRLEMATQHLKKMEVLFDNAEEEFSRYYGKLYMAEGKFEEAIPYLDKEMKSISNVVAGELGFCYAKLGNREKAIEYLNSIPDNLYDLNASIIHFALEEQDSAYYYLNKCIDQGLELGTIKNDPVFNPYRKEARFQELMSKIKQQDLE